MTNFVHKNTLLIAIKEKARKNVQKGNNKYPLSVLFKQWCPSSITQGVVGWKKEPVGVLLYWLFKCAFNDYCLWQLTFCCVSCWSNNSIICKYHQRRAGRRVKSATRKDSLRAFLWLFSLLPPL